MASAPPDVDPTAGGQPAVVEFSFVLPCLNEAATLATCLAKIRQTIARHQLSAEIVVADNGSRDGSQALAEQAGARVVAVAQRGYGAALMAGMRAARGTFVIMGDADDSYDFSAVDAFIEQLRGGHDLVMGCRFPRRRGRIMPGAMPWLHRWVGTPALTWLGRLLFRAPFSDFNCGLRGFRRDRLLALQLRSSGMEFASEMIIKATVHRLRMTEVPIVLHRDGRNRTPHLRPWRDGWRHLRLMLCCSPRWLFLMPGVVLLLCGTTIGTRLLWGPWRVGHVQFDTNTLLICAMALLTGFQLVTFAVFARLYAVACRLLPPESWVQWVRRRFSLEGGLLCGIAVALFGLSLLGWETLYWEQHNYGIISYPESLRVVIPGVTSTMLGVQICFSSFFLSLLDVPTARSETPTR